MRDEMRRNFRFQIYDGITSFRSLRILMLYIVISVRVKVLL